MKKCLAPLQYLSIKVFLNVYHKKKLITARYTQLNSSQAGQCARVLFYMYNIMYTLLYSAFLFLLAATCCSIALGILFPLAYSTHTYTERQVSAVVCMHRHCDLTHTCTYARAFL